jgi:hypothetical protein
MGVSSSGQKLTFMCNNYFLLVHLVQLIWILILILQVFNNLQKGWKKNHTTIDVNDDPFATTKMFKEN